MVQQHLINTKKIPIGIKFNKKKYTLRAPISYG